MADGSGRVETLLTSVPEAAGALGIGRSTLYRLIAAGEIPIVKVGGSTKIARADIDTFLAIRRQRRAPGANAR